MNIQGLLSGKKIVIIGAAGLLGSKISEELTANGAKCILGDVSLEKVRELENKLNLKCQDSCSSLEISICDTDSVLSFISKADELLGGIDGLINTAYPRNKQYGCKFENVTYNSFCENVNLHLGGYFLVSQKILEYFKQRKSGKLLNISSIYGVVAPKFDIYNGTPMTMPVEYAAIKAGLIHLTKYMAKYYAGNNITVNCLSLGGLFDNQPESFLENYKNYCIDKGMLDPRDIVGTVVFAMSEASRYINGQNLIVDDGFTI